MEKMNISEQMMSFEKVFEDLDVKTDGITSALDNVVGSSIDQDEVSQLLNQMQGEQALDAQGNMVAAKQGQVNVASAQQNNEFEEMQKKLDSLKAMP